MENFYELHDLTFSIKKETVFKSMNCYEDSPVYEDVVDAYEEIYEDMLALVENPKFMDMQKYHIMRK